MGLDQRSLVTGWNGLSGNIRGILWVLMGAILFSATDVVVKTLGRTFDALELGLFRYAIGMVILTPVFLRMGARDLKTKRWGIHLLRMVLAFLAQLGIFIAVIHLDLADATAFFFSKPIFITIFAVFILSETVGVRRWIATLTGFAGILIIVRPGVEAINPVALIAVGSALAFALANVLTRKMSDTEPPTRILFYYHLGGVVVFAGPAIWVWRTPVGLEWLMLVATGALTTAAMVCFVHAYSVGEANAVGPLEYVRLIYAALLGYYLFSEIPTRWTVIGSLIIVASSLYIARDKARRPAAGETPS
jgi:drug/metabolite transporter (DMT)-like permease